MPAGRSRAWPARWPWTSARSGDGQQARPSPHPSRHGWNARLCGTQRTSPQPAANHQRRARGFAGRRGWGRASRVGECGVAAGAGACRRMLRRGPAAKAGSDGGALITPRARAVSNPGRTRKPAADACSARRSFASKARSLAGPRSPAGSRGRNRTGRALRTSRTSRTSGPDRAGEALWTGWPCWPLWTRAAHAAYDDAGEQRGHKSYDDGPAEIVGGPPLLELIHASPDESEPPSESRRQANCQDK